MKSQRRVVGLLRRRSQIRSEILQLDDLEPRDRFAAISGLDPRISQLSVEVIAEAQEPPFRQAIEHNNEIHRRALHGEEFQEWARAAMAVEDWLETVDRRVKQLVGPTSDALIPLLTTGYVQRFVSDYLRFMAGLSVDLTDPE